MSFLGSVLRSIGHVAGDVAGFIPGVGPLGGALVGALEEAATGGGLKGALEGAAMGAAGGLAGKALSKVAGAGKLGSALPAADTAASDAALSTVPTSVTAVATQPEGLGGVLRRAGGAVVSAIKKHPDLALAAADTLYSANQDAIAKRRLRDMDRDAKARYQQALGVLGGAGPAPTIPDPAQGTQYLRPSAYRSAAGGGGY